MVACYWLQEVLNSFQLDAKQDEISLIGHNLVYAKNIVAPGPN